MVVPRLRYPILLSIGAAVLTVGLKTVAYFLTDSVGLLSDAVESLVNLAAALTAYFSLLYAARPVDQTHTYGHEKIEFFSSGLEGMLILAAAAGIAWLALRRLFTPEALQPLGLGLMIGLTAALINGAVGLILVRAGKAHRSIVLEADGRHLLTDVWTSAGVLSGLGLAALTGWQVLDPLVALLVAANIVWTGVNLIWRSFNGLMDHAQPQAEQDAARSAIETHLEPRMDYHALRTRQAGARRFVDFHLLVPGDMSVRQAHALTGRIEAALQLVLSDLEVTVHVEPIEEPSAWDDSALLPIEKELRRERQERAHGARPGSKSGGASPRFPPDINQAGE
jgi:cation diffusion facilitator family transporter